MFSQTRKDLTYDEAGQGIEHIDHFGGLANHGQVMQFGETI